MAPKKTWEQYIEIDPIAYKSPEFNPRTRAVYYRKGLYKTFRDLMNLIAPTLVPKGWRKFQSAVKVQIRVCKDKPKTSKRKWPQGDVDNYAKGILDRFNDIVYKDDDQIVELTVIKQWSTKKHKQGIHMTVTSL